MQFCSFCFVFIIMQIPRIECSHAMLKFSQRYHKNLVPLKSKIDDSNLSGDLKASGKLHLKPEMTIIFNVKQTLT